MAFHLSKFVDKVYLMAEGGSHYCSKKSDDICSDVCDEVIRLTYQIRFTLNQKEILDLRIALRFLGLIDFILFAERINVVGIIIKKLESLFSC